MLSTWTKRTSLSLVRQLSTRRFKFSSGRWYSRNSRLLASQHQCKHIACQVGSSATKSVSVERVRCTNGHFTPSKLASYYFVKTLLRFEQGLAGRKHRDKIAPYRRVTLKLKYRELQQQHQNTNLAGKFKFTRAAGLLPARKRPKDVKCLPE